MGEILLVGAILAQGKRTVATALRGMGLSDERRYQNYHWVLNCAVWSSHTLSPIPLRILVHTVVSADAPSCWDWANISNAAEAKIAAKGIYRDDARSSKSFFIKTSGLRWVVILLLVPIPWAQRVWVLPFLTVPTPSERYHTERGQRLKTLTDCERQLNRAIVVVADSTCAVLELLASGVGLPTSVAMITRLRLDAASYDPPPLCAPGKRGEPRKKGARQPALAWYGHTSRIVDTANGKL